MAAVAGRIGVALALLLALGCDDGDGDGDGGDAGVSPDAQAAAPDAGGSDAAGGEADAATPEPDGALGPPMELLEDEVFGDVEGFLGEVRGSTEDLAFDGDRIIIGVPGGLASVDAEGTVSDFGALNAELGGSVLGVALDADGGLYVCDPDNGALRYIVDLDVATVIDGLDAPNYVAVGPDGDVYVTDPCAGELIRYDPDAGEVIARHAFDLPAEGGPNGVAFGPDGSLWGVTENTALLCNHADTVELTAPIAKLFRMEITADGFGARETIVDNIGLFGDGIAFDVQGNVYYIADTTEGVMLDESQVWVLPVGSETPTKILVAGEGGIYANLAFGTGPFGETTLYLSMLAFPGFATERGLRRVEVGIPGLPLLR